MNEPDWDNASDQQIRQVYTSAGLAVYNFLKWGAVKLNEDAGDAWPALDLAPATDELRRNFYAARAHWRRGDKRTAARLMYRTGALSLRLYQRITALAAQEPALLRRINALGLRGYANAVARVIDTTAEGVSNVASGIGTALFFGAIIAVALVLK